MFFQPTAVAVLLVVSISGDEEPNEVSSFGAGAGGAEERQQQEHEDPKDNDTGSLTSPSPPLPSDQLFSTDAYGVSDSPQDGKQEEGTGGECPCPCSEKGTQTVCGQTTYGQTRTFQSECHLICFNMCSSSVRYALVRSEICLPPVVVSDVTGQASFLPGQASFIPPVRRGGGGLGGGVGGGSTLGPAEWACDCGYCPVIDRLRPDYYPICSERMGRRTTFDSWCHFDCENRCYEHTKQPHIFLYRGPCIAEPQYPGTYPIVLDLDRDGGLCRICAEQCRTIHEPVCARGALGQHLPFKSRCHLRCHNQCHFYSSEAQFYQVHDGDCRWVN